jgi:hypothetical protein
LRSFSASTIDTVRPAGPVVFSSGAPVRMRPKSNSQTPGFTSFTDTAEWRATGAIGSWMAATRRPAGPFAVRAASQARSSKPASRQPVGSRRASRRSPA